MASIRPLHWDTTPVGDFTLTVGAYQAAVWELADEHRWFALHGPRRIAEGVTCTAERARAAAETAITRHQTGDAE